MAPTGKPNCWKNHLALLTVFVVVLVGFAMAMLDRQQALADKQDVRLRAVELYRAEALARDQATQATLQEIKADLKEIKVAVAVRSKP